MILTISHDRAEESIEAKAKWFQSLSLQERMEVFCSFTELLLAGNPKIVEQRDAELIARGVRIVSAA